MGLFMPVSIHSTVTEQASARVAVNETYTSITRYLASLHNDRSIITLNDPHLVRKRQAEDPCLPARKPY
jgi:hypothetical protein